MRLLITLALLFISFQSLDGQRNFPRKISSRLNFFDIELLSATASQKKGNVMVSPASIKSTLALILAGAEGDTARELEDALRISHGNEDVKKQMRWFSEALRGNTNTTVLHNANGIFVSKKLKLKPAYEALTRKEYHTEVTPVDFTDPVAAATTINNWVSRHTNGLIPFVVEPLHVTPPNDLILANALYFKSSWQYAFNPRETRSSCFYRDGECKMVAMMDLETDLNYAPVDDLKAHAVELPYVGRRYSMILLVPLMRDGVKGLLRDLPYVGLPKILDMMRPSDVTLSMPRFSVNYNEDLVEALRKLHITTLLSNKSNLSNIFEGAPPQVNSFHHKVFMSVDEVGTVAAAASAAAIVPLMFDGSVQVRADRPFVFFIRDNDLGIVLFEGKIEEPNVLEAVPSSTSTSTSTSTSSPPSALKEIPIIFPDIDMRHAVEAHKDNTKQNSKPSSFVESLKNFFG